MSFANLFTRLSAVEEGVTSPGPSASTHRSGNGDRGNGRKRKTQGCQAGPDTKKPCHRGQTSRPRNESEHTNVGFTNNQKTKNNQKKNKQKKQKPWQKNQHQQNNGGRPPFRNGGGDRRNRNYKQEVQAKRPRTMTQEFIDQNVLMVDGRSLCKHFLWGRCIKGDECQLEHIQGYNDLIKEVCKFYVQGFCTKGGSCPYMHKSFPCKFFHRKGKCSNGANCKFSHEPLNDVTNNLLEEALKREHELYELAKKAEQESSGQPANTDEPEILVTKITKVPDIFMQPLRPKFYTSADTNAEEEASLSQTTDLPANVEEPSEASRHHSPPVSASPNQEEPVCYSVEAVLGPQLSKPFTSFFNTPRSQESAPSSDCTARLSYESQVPYSVDAVLRSCKSGENSTVSPTPAPPTAQTISYTPKSYFEKITDPPPRSENQNKTMLYSLRNEVNNLQEKMSKSLSPLPAQSDLISKNRPAHTAASKDHTQRDGDEAESVRPAQRAPQNAKLDLSTDITHSVNCDSLPLGRANCESVSVRASSQTSAAATRLKPNLIAQTLDSQASSKPVCLPSGFTECKGRAAVPTESVSSCIKSNNPANSVSHHVAAKEPRGVQPHPKKAKSGPKLATKQDTSDETTAESNSEMMHSGDLAVACKKTPKRPFFSLFASPVVDAAKDTEIDDSVISSSCPQGSTQSASRAPPAADCRSNHPKTALEPDKASAKSFLSLFAAPLPCMPPQSDYSRTPSCSQQSDRSGDTASNSSDSKPKASHVRTPLQHQLRTDVKKVPGFSNSSPNVKIGKDSSTEPVVNQPAKRPVSPVKDSVCETSPSPCANSPSTRPAHRQQLPDISPCKESAPAKSVLKTLFLGLNMHQLDEGQQDGVQISKPSDCEKNDQSSSKSVFVKQQRKSNKKARRKKKQELRMKIQDSYEPTADKTVAHSQAHLSSPRISLDATLGGHVGKSSLHDTPSKPVAPQQVTGNLVATPLKDLFKSLDTSFFHLGD